jgi:hypothetical protein
LTEHYFSIMLGIMPLKNTVSFGQKSVGRILIINYPTHSGIGMGAIDLQPRYSTN